MTSYSHTEFALLNFSYELLIIFGISCTVQSTPCEHWPTVQNRFLQQPMKGVEIGVCQNNDGGTRTLVDSDILNKKMFSDLPKSML